MAIITFPKTKRLGRIRLDREPYGRKGWVLTVQLGPGAGYRWIDFGHYSMNVSAPWYKSLSISGRTLRVGRNVKVNNKRRGFAAHGLSKNANKRFYPGWW